MEILGIDVGGSGIKGAIVDTQLGDFISERHRIETPQPAKPEVIAQVICEIADFFGWQGKMGVGFPSVIKDGVIKTAANIDKSCIGVNAEALISETIGRKTKVFNDADTAGYAELKFGGVKDFNGLGIFLTVGTGIGSAVIFKGQLIPSTEFGHLTLPNGLLAEKYASDAARKRDDLNWNSWGERFNEYLHHLELLFSPQLFIIGGGTSKKFHKFEDSLSIQAEIKPATLLNKAGIIGAALLAEQSE